MSSAIKNSIGYDLSEGTGKTFYSVNPGFGMQSEIAVYFASADDIDLAMQKASRAAGLMAGITSGQRALFLERIAENILELGDSLIDVCCKETGLPNGRITGERGRTVGQIRMFAKYIREGSWVDASIDTALPDRQPAPKPDIRRMLIPVGPVVVFGASNFPLAFSVAGGDTISALAAGNPVVVKAHPAHPVTSSMIRNCINNAAKETGMPDGVFSLLFDSGFEVGRQIVQHPLSKAVGFTGSYLGGKALFDLATTRPEPIPVFAEMGSVNPIFILPEAMQKNGEAIGMAIAASVTLGAGQFCTNPGLVILPDSAGSEAFIKTLADSIRLSIPQTMLTPVIAERYAADANAIISRKPVSLLSASVNETSGNQGTPKVATVFGDEFESNPGLAEEVFGPFSLVVLCSSREQFIRIAGNLKGQLTAGIYYYDGPEIASYDDLIHILENKAGRLVFNGVPTGVEVCHSMQHGGPFPASTDSRFTSVGTSAIRRWARPVAFQDCPGDLLPPELKDGNPLDIWRLHNGQTGKI
jgi:NADP-dependent aldehyde dehydrogenase